MGNGANVMAGNLLVAIGACVPAVGSSEGHDAAPRGVAVEVVEPDESPAVVRGSWRLSVDGSPPGPLRALPRPAVPEGDEAFHATTMGWSADDRTFVYCRELPQMDCHACRLVGRDGAVQTLEAGAGCAEPMPRAQLDATIEAAGVGASTTPMQPPPGDVVLMVDGREGERTNAGQARPMLKVGARADEGEPVAWSVFVDPCEGCGIDQACANRAHVEMLAPSHDGSHVAVLLHISGGARGDVLRLEIIATTRLTSASSSR
ncbi:MAG: hypothetical protein K0V04_20165 [Deltaproteobacteria bacterium]|nr:hypothetical protein [Deltaproteobacteria bacterium]